jgi:hypothetical protein
MRFLALFSSLTLTFSLLAVDFNPAGTWQGVMIRKGTRIKDATIVYFDFVNEDGNISGFSREETYDSPYFSVKKLDGDMSDGKVDFKQFVETKSNKSARSKWCRVSSKLTYDPSTGYLTGQYIATDCRNVVGDFILYRSNFKLSTGDEMESSQIWFEQFVKDYADDLNAPEIRKIERDNFVFEPIFFDYDKYVIRDEHNAFFRWYD